MAMAMAVTPASASSSEPRAAAGIRVCARFRPQNKLELKQQAVECVRVGGGDGDDSDSGRVQIESAGKSEKLTFTFDQVFGTASTQREVYDATAKPLVESALRGYNCTCFVYGQTGTGKTFSMEGVPGDSEYAGIIPRVMADVFDGIQNMQAELEFIVRVSYIEIYLEKIRDLLKPSSNNLSVRESRERGVWVAGATEVCCASADEMMAVMQLGGTNRVISSTRMNNDSSRSHSVFIITIEQRNVATGSTRSGKLFLVDLAGSEKVGKTHAKGQTLKEAQHINKSLSALGSVMNALTSGQANAHIPYRDSKLTRLLQDSLGGNSETTLLVCGSCSSYNSEETVSTLRFGTRAKSIKNKPKVNEEKTVAEYKVLVAEKDKHIAVLTEQLAQLRGAEPVESSGGGATGTDVVAPTVPPLPAAEALADRVQELLIKIEQLEDEQASKAGEVASLEERCAELELQTKESAQLELARESAQNQRDELLHKVAFLESELAAKAHECSALHELLEKRRSKTSSPSSSSEASSLPAARSASIAEDSELPPPQPVTRDASGSVESVASMMDKPVSERPRGESTAVLDNELLRQQLGARTHELQISMRRIEQLAEELGNCRIFYEQQVFALQERLREYDAHIHGLVEVSESDDKATQLDKFMQTTKTLRSVRGGGGATAGSLPHLPLMRPRDSGAMTSAMPANVAATATPLQRSRIVSSATSQDGWLVDDEVFPVAPIDMESPVVKRLISSMPERGREKMAKWLVFVLEGRDIRANFHPEISIEGINESLNRDMRKLIVPLLKNRRDLDVQSFVRTRFVRVTDLKITLAHKHQDTVHVEATRERDAASDVGSDKSSRSNSLVNGTGASAVSSKVWAHDHVFYGPKTDPASALVLHSARVLLPSKDRFTSEPVDLSASVNESKSILDMHTTSSSSHSSSGASASTGGSQSATQSSTSLSSGNSSGGGGMFGRLRSKTGVGLMLGDVKSLITARMHKHHVHDDTLCDGCGMSPIVGGRWKCSTCESFELCDACYGTGIHGYEISNEMCRRIEHAAVAKHRVLGEFPELLELFRRHICHDDVIQFRRVVDWLADMVSGTHVASIHRKVIVKSGLHPEIRARLVAQLGALASERQDIVLKTEWFVEPSTTEDAESGEDDAEGDREDAASETASDVGSERSASTTDAATTTTTAAAVVRRSLSSVSNASAPPDVQLETLRMYVTDATIEETVESVRKHSYADLLEPAPVVNHRSASTASSSSAAAVSDPVTLEGKAIKSVTSVAF